ncbi:MAG: uncharacterized protein JWM86_2971 [Thermoleophilia bacterium]|nr:uncharacterized protein [Thermoleophilia bacterium]
MRLRTIHLTRFGHFTDHAIELADTTGMHVLYGGNEAGKTTLLDAITYTLFGWPSDRSSRTYAFQHKTSQLLAGLTLASESGDIVDVRRRKGNKATLMSPGTGAASPELEGQLAVLLRGLTADQWTSRHALTQARLRAGGEAMLASGGDASQAFATAEDGIGVVYGVLEQITARREALLTSAGRSGILLEQIKAYESASQVVKTVAADVERYEQDVARRDEIAATLDRMRGDQVRLTTEAEHVGHARAAAAELARWRELTEALEAIPEPTAQWTAADHEGYVALRASLAALQAQVTTLESQVTTAEAKLAEQQVDAALLAASDEIAALQERLGQVRDARAELTSLEARVLVAERALASAMQEAAITCDPSQVADAVPARTLRDALRGAANRREELEAAATTTRTSLEAAHVALTDAQAALDALGAGGADSESALAALLADGASIQPDEHRAASAALRSRREALEHRAAALPGCSVDLAGVRSLALPAEADLAELQLQFAELDAARIAQEEVRRSVHAHLPGKREALDALEADGVVPDMQTLAELRGTRDDAWHAIRDAIVDAGDLTTAREAAPTFDGALRDADDYADAIARDGERAGQAAALRRDIAGEEARLERAETESARIADAHRALLAGPWTTLWAASGIRATSPEAMAALTTDIETLRSDALVLEVDETAHAAAELRISGLVRELRSALDAAPAADAPLDVAAFATLYAQAIELRRRQDGVREQRAAAQANLDTATRQHAGAERAANAASRELREHSVVWAGAGDAMSFNVSTGTPGDARTRCDAIDTVESAVSAMNDAVAARDAAQSLLDRFAADVEAVVGALGAVDRFDLSAPELVASTLGANVREAQLVDQRRTAAAERLDDLRQELATRRGDQVAARTRLDAARNAVGVADDIALAELDAAWVARDAIQLELRALDAQLLASTRLAATQLLELRGGDEDAALAARIAQLGARASELETEATVLAQERDVLVERIGAAESSIAVAEARQQQATALARIEQLVPELRSLAIQEQLLTDFLELQSREARGPLLDRASDLFARLTCRRYAGIVLDRTDTGATVLRAARVDDAPVGVDGLSEGARDQFFLALRLASILTELDAGGEPMPLVVDDILLAFDDERSRATLEVLGEVAERVQVLFLTHHDHLVTLATSVNASWTPVDIAAGGALTA